MRKVMGAGNFHVIALFMGEAVFMNLLAAGLSLVAIELALPAFSSLIHRELSLTILNDHVFWITLAVLLAAGAVISGILPALSLFAGKVPGCNYCTQGPGGHAIRCCNRICFQCNFRIFPVKIS